MLDMFKVRFWTKMWCSEVFDVWSCCFLTRLVLEQTIWCSWTVQFFVMFDMFKFRFWDKMLCSETLMFDSIWCSFQDYSKVYIQYCPNIKAFIESICMKASDWDFEMKLAQVWIKTNDLGLSINVNPIFFPLRQKF